MKIRKMKIFCSYFGRDGSGTSFFNNAIVGIDYKISSKEHLISIEERLKEDLAATQITILNFIYLPDEP